LGGGQSWRRRRRSINAVSGGESVQRQ